MDGSRFSKALAVLFLSAAMATPAFAATSQKQAERGGLFVMPDGVESVDAYPLKEVIFTMVPGGDELLVSQKEQSVALGAGADESDVLSVPTQKSLSAPGPLYATRTCNTNVATTSAPSDIHGAVGPTRLVVVTNVNVGIFNKTDCTTVSNVGLKTFFGGFSIPATQSLFDPRVLYDRVAGRFLVTAESRDSGNTDQYQYFAISRDSTAATWWVYRVALSSGTSFFCKKAANSFWDYPSAGKSSARWFIAANDFPATGGTFGAILAIDKAPSLTGGGVGIKCFNNLQYNIAPPIVLDSNTQSVFLAPRSTSILRYNHTAGATVGADTLAGGVAYTIPAWSAPPDAVQPNGQKLDSLDGRFQSASIQSMDRIWNIHAVASGTRSLIRWYRLQRSASAVLSTVTFQSTSTSHLFNPSFVTNSGIDGSPAYITASRTEPAATCTAASCRAAMITMSGPNSTGSYWGQSLAAMSTANFATDGFGVACNNTSRGSCRWGDYSSVTVEPNGAGNAWAFNQLINGTTQFNWFTRGANEVYNNQY